MALPAMQYLIQQSVLCSVATTDKDAEVVSDFSYIANNHNISYTSVTHADHAGQLRSWLMEHMPDVVFVMTYAWRIPVDLLAVPRYGFLNFHFGLLPEMRGADPVFESIRQQQTKAGLTVHLMDAGFDTGPLVVREEIPLPLEFTYGMLCSQMARLAENTCRQLVQSMLNGYVPAGVVQEESKARYWPKVSKEEIRVNWMEMNAATVAALIRSCNPIARGVPVRLNGWELGVYDVSEVALDINVSKVPPGTILALDAQNGLVVLCKDGKAVKIEVIITGEGIFPGHKLALWGVNAGMCFS
jgi:methionyl-tRNA formyltransferase